METSLPDVQAVAEIDQRLNRNGLTALDRAQLIVRRKKLYDRMHRRNESAGPPGPDSGETV